MNVQATRRGQSSEAGVAMLIAIFVMLLVGVVAITLILSSGTESALAGNYRSATSAYYAALAGLEEGRGRLPSKSPNSLSNANVFGNNFALPLSTNQVFYIKNPANGEDVLTAYPDKEYDQEFGNGALEGATVSTTGSTSPVAGIPGQLYRWVRVNAITGQALTFNNSIGPGRLYFDGAHLTNTANAAQALEITSLAVLPNGTQKMLQYIVSPALLNAISFPAALTLVGTSPVFTPGTAQFPVNGDDQSGPSVAPCPGLPGPPLSAIGYTGTDASHITATPPANYPGVGGSATVPSVNSVSLPPNLQTVNGLNALVQSISQSADVTLAGPAVASQMPMNMSATTPQTIVVNGDLNLTGWNSIGYGVLLVTGNLTYDPDSSWEGIVLVIGKGTINSVFNGGGEFDGAVFVARTVDALNNPIVPPAPLGQPSVTVSTGNGGNGIFYSSCWINAAQKPTTYKILSFREIPTQ